MGRFLLSISIVFFSTISSSAQQGYLSAYTDQAVYIAGEKIWFAGMKMNNPSDKDQPVNIYLVDRSGTVVEKVHLMDAEGRIYGNLQLGGNIVTDNYLIAVTSMGYKQLFIPVTVINPVKPAGGDGGSVIAYQQKPVSNLVLKSGKETYSKREAVTVSVEAPADLETYIAVTRKDALSEYVDSIWSSWPIPELEIVENVPAGEGQQINVTVFNSANELAAGVRVFASVLGDQANIASAVTDAKGTALMSIPYIYGNVSLVFSAVGGTGQAYRVVYEDPAIQIKGSVNLPTLKLEERFRASISERILNTEVTNKYRAELKTRFVTGGLDTTDFYGKPDKRYMLDDYTRIPNMEEILYEYVQEARARKLGDKSQVLVFNTPFKTFFELPALVMLDGVPVSDVDQLLALDPLQLKSVDIIAKKFLLDDLQISGIVHYKSYKADLGGYKLPPQDIIYAFQGNAIPVIPLFTEYSKENDERLPDMRNLLYWQPFVKGAKSWSFYTSDVEGDYTITVRGVDKEGKEYKGELGMKVK